MLNETDLKESRETLHVIAHLKEGASTKLSFLEILGIFEFILLSIKAIMFTKDGKPKTKIQLLLSFPAIIGFIRDLVRRINKETREKRATRIEKAISGIKPGEQITARDNIKRDGKLWNTSK